MTERERAVDVAIAQIERQFGKGSIMKMKPGEINPMQIDAIPTGSIALDLALGIGGVPRGRIVEIYGPESSGKTTLALHIIAEAQKLGGMAAIIDAEHALDPVYAGRLGVNLEELLISQPDTGEQALEIAETLVRSGALDIDRDRLGRGAGAEGRDRGRHGRLPCRPAGPPDEPGAAEADRAPSPARTPASSSSTSCG